MTLKVVIQKRMTTPKVYDYKIFIKSSYLLIISSFRMHWYKQYNEYSIESTSSLNVTERALRELYSRYRKPRNHLDSKQSVRLELSGKSSRSVWICAD